MQLTIFPSRLKGVITPPPSKSQLHRCILLASLADGCSQLHNAELSEDIQATLCGVAAWGADWSYEDSTLYIQGKANQKRTVTGLPCFDCGESGSTLRFLMPLALVLTNGGRFIGHGRLMQRPQQPYFDLFAQQGIIYQQENQILLVSGQLQAGNYSLRGDISSQFFTGLLLALPLLSAPSRIHSTTAIQSQDYLNLTLYCQRQAGVVIEQQNRDFFCPGNASYHPLQISIEADWSQAAFWYAAQFSGNPLQVIGMKSDSVQGDKRVLAFLQKMDSDVPCYLDVSDCPDLVPPLAAAAALRVPGAMTCFTQAQRLRLKESDRLHSIYEVLQNLQIPVQELPDGLRITSCGSVSGGQVSSSHDHRIAMMTAILATRAQASVTLTGAECVAKSYPDFWQQYQRLGGHIRIEGD